jgi:small-conductance mechanosensitive channel
MGLVLFGIGLRLSHRVSKAIRNRVLDPMELEPNIAEILETITRYLFIILMTFIVLDVAHVPLTAFTFVGGALTLGIGFGSQNIINNFISGLIIMVEQPIRVGDVIELPEKPELLGRVMAIGARCINLRTFGNIDVLVPNSVMLQNTIINLTLNDGNVRSEHIIPIDIAQEVPTKIIEDTLMGILTSHKYILRDPTPSVYFSSFENGAIQFEIMFWINMLHPDVNRKAIISDINHIVWDKLQELNVRVAPGLRGMDVAGNGR